MMHPPIRTHVTFLSLNADWDREKIKERRKDSKDNKSTNGIVGFLYKYDTTVKMDALLFMEKKVNYNTTLYPRVLDFCNGVEKSKYNTPLDFLSKHALYGIADKEYLGDDRDKLLSLRASGEFSYNLHPEQHVEQKDPLYSVPDVIDKSGKLSLYAWNDENSLDRKIVFVWVPKNVYEKALNIHMHDTNKFKELVDERVKKSGVSKSSNYKYPQQTDAIDILVYYDAFQKEIESHTFGYPMPFSVKMFGKKVTDSVKKPGNTNITDDALVSLKKTFCNTFLYEPSATSTSGGKGGPSSGITLQFK